MNDDVIEIGDIPVNHLAPALMFPAVQTMSIVFQTMTLAGCGGALLMHQFAPPAHSYITGYSTCISWQVSLNEYFDGQDPEGKNNRDFFEAAVDVEDRSTISVTEINSVFNDPTTSLGKHVGVWGGHCAGIDSCQMLKAFPHGQGTASAMPSLNQTEGFYAAMAECHCGYYIVISLLAMTGNCSSGLEAARESIERGSRA